MLPHHTSHLSSVAPVASAPTPMTGDEGPACLSCRKRKLRCSREQPACSQCLRLASDCFYDQKRQKPGLKAGAIEGINRRLEFLEQKLSNIDETGGARSTSAIDPADVQGCLYHASLLLTNHLREQACIDSAHASDQSNPQTTSGPAALSSNCHRPLAHVGINAVSPNSSNHAPSNKRRRIASPNAKHDRHRIRDGQLPSRLILDNVINKYFATVHHWIPTIHERRFRARLDDPIDSQNLIILLHALIAVALKHVDAATVGLRPQEVEEQIALSTDFVALRATESISIENAQALVLLCWERMGSADWPKAWPVLGALTRSVDYLQLTIEPSEHRSKPLLAPLVLLAEPQSHAEAEERKRVFWTAFMLDRLCSLTCGWSTDFTSDNVSRRLPCNGGIWRRNEASNTPYFGLWEKSQAKLGAPVAYLQTHRASPNEQSSVGRGLGGSNAIDISQLGALAYRIEATESLTQVSSFFLQQLVDFTNRKELEDWLTRFKELDLRLVHWKQFLPDRWKQSNVSKDAIVKMDPNLTLAHVTHNASMILLHQHIAYPSAPLKRTIKLPSFCSADTCERAAIETSAMTSRYLRSTDDMMLNSEFVFCLFCAARILLVHSHYYNTVLNKEFDTIVLNLQEMSRRWQGYQGEIYNRDDGEGGVLKLDLAGTYALRLQEYRTACERSHHDPGVLSGILGRSGASAFLLTNDIGSSLVSPPNAQAQSNPGSSEGHRDSPNSHNRVSSRAARSEQEEAVTPMHFPRELTEPYAASAAMQSPSQLRSMPANTGAYYDAFAEPQDNLMAMCDTLLGQSFTDLDRVIPFDGTTFSFNPVDVQDFGYVGYGNY